MYHPQSQYDSNGIISPILGFLSSVFLSSIFLEVAQNAMIAFLCGMVGAAGGWVFNLVKKYIEKKFK